MSKLAGPKRHHDGEKNGVNPSSRHCLALPAYPRIRKLDRGHTGVRPQSISAATAGKEKQSETDQDIGARRTGGADHDGIRRRIFGYGNIDPAVQQ